MHAEITLSRFGYSILILDVEMEEVAEHHAGNHKLDSGPIPQSVSIDHPQCIPLRELATMAAETACNMLEEEEAKQDEEVGRSKLARKDSSS